MNQVVEFAKGIQDAFHRVRTSDPVTLFDWQARYGLEPLLWEATLAGSGTQVHLPNECAIRLRTTTASGDSVIRQTAQYHHYQPLKSHLVAATFVLGAAATNVRKRVGYFDDSNGIFLQQTGTGLALVRRTSVTGSVVDNVVAQADWNLNPLDGTGDGNTIVLDPTKASILVIDLQFLGVGEVRVGFDIDGTLIYVHEFHNSNNLSTVYMTTADLPIRYEITNTGTATSATNDFKQICCAVVSEGGFEEARGIPFAAGNGITTIAVTTRRPVLSIKPSLTFASVVNRIPILLDNVEVQCAANVLVEVIYNGTLTGASYGAVDSSSAMTFDVAATDISGGNRIGAWYVTSAGGAARGSSSKSLSSRLPLCVSGDGSTARQLSVVITSLSGSAATAAMINWRELR